MRIRDKWRTDKNRSIEEQATAIAYVIWQIALHSTKNLHQEKFDFESDNQRVEVISEYLVYLCHIADRHCHTNMIDKTRQQYMQSLVTQVGKQLQRNTEAILGSGDYRTHFLALSNKRFSQYAKCAFDKGLPGFSARRLLGNEIQHIMGGSQTNKWVIQQIIDIDCPEAGETLMKSLHRINGN